MGMLFPLLIIAVLVAFNVFVSDSLSRVRSDIAVIRRAVTANAAPPSPKSSAAARGKKRREDTDDDRGGSVEDDS